MPQVLLTDDFSGSTIDTAKWKLDNTSFDTGTATVDSAVALTNGQAKIEVTHHDVFNGTLSNVGGRIGDQEVFHLGCAEGPP